MGFALLGRKPWFYDHSITGQLFGLTSNFGLNHQHLSNADGSNIPQQRKALEGGVLVKLFTKTGVYQ